MNAAREALHLSPFTLHASGPLALAAALLLGACGDRAGFTLDGAGFRTPESALHDPIADVYLVSNINGSPSELDDNGFISRVTPQGRVEALRWIDGARDDVTLNAPKGMAFRGDTLFVADIDHVRLFDRTTGAPLGAWPAPRATFLNDLAVAPDGVLYGTDSGVRFTADGTEDTGTDAVLRFGPSGRVDRLVSGAALGRPNGIVAEPDRLVLVTFGSGQVFDVRRGTGQVQNMPRPPAGGLDGVVAVGGGEYLLSSWGGSAVYRLDAAGVYTTVLDSLDGPADIGWDAGRRRVLVPVFNRDALVVREVR